MNTLYNSMSKKMRFVVDERSTTDDWTNQSVEIASQSKMWLFKKA